jgi:excisionase family DNA binding protein
MVAQALYSVDEVAQRLALHVRTVRTYVREGRLRAVRIGKQYRISHDDLAAFTGGAVPALPRESAVRRRTVDVSSVVSVDAIDRASADRITTTLLAAVGGRPDRSRPLRIQADYDEERARLRAVLLGDPADCAEALRLIATLTEES